MAMERWNPFQEMMSLRQAMDRLLEESVVRPGSSLGQMAGRGGGGGFPIDVAENDEGFEVRATLPGVKPDDVQLTIHNDTLVIRAESRLDEERREGKDQRWLVREHRAQSYQRAISLPSPVDADHANARFEHGVLTLTIPKSEAAKPRQIQIQGGGQGTAQLGVGGGASAGGASQEGSAPGAQTGQGSQAPGQASSSR